MRIITKLKIDEKIDERNEKLPEHRELDRKLIAELSDTTYGTICNLNKEAPEYLNVIYRMLQILDCTFEELIETIED